MTDYLQVDGTLGNILVIDAPRANLQLLFRLLSGQGYTVRQTVAN